MNLEWFALESADEYISSDAERPSVLAGQTTGHLPAGHDLSGIPGVSGISPVTQLPFAVHFIADIRATGSLEGTSFKGDIWYKITYAIALPPMLVRILSSASPITDSMAYAMWGYFEATVASIPHVELAKNTAPAS